MTDTTHTLPRAFSDINRTKADFSAIYVQPDPRAYFHVLGGLDYIIPHLAQPVFAQLVEARLRAKAAPITVLDLGCSYGVNGALLKYGFSFDMLRERYAASGVQGLSPLDMLRLDRHFSAAWPARRNVRVIGLDASRPAITYAESCGYIDEGIVADLESDDLDDRTAAKLADVDLIISTGCVGYITVKTFNKLAVCTGGSDAPWAVSFVLRMFDYKRIAQSLLLQGLITEKFEGATFIQRRFRDSAEMNATLRTLETQGIDPRQKESDGLFHAELFVSRPAVETQACPINRMISIASGANRAYGLKPKPRSFSSSPERDAFLRLTH